MNYIDTEYAYDDDGVAKPIVIDNGSSKIRAGFCGENEPRSNFPSVIGRPRHSGVMVGMAQHDRYFGLDAIAKRGILSLKYPIQNGIVHNWNDIELIWHHTFYNELRIQPEEHFVCLTESPLNPKENRETITKIMFETFNVASFALVNRSILSLYKYGKLSGIVLNCGDNHITATPIHEGYVLPQTIRINKDFGGRDITEYLRQLLNYKGYSFTTTAEREIVRDIKEKLCYVSLNHDAERRESENNKFIECDYELPDGQIIKINEERFKCTETLFKPSLIGDKFKECSGIHQLVYDSIMKCDKDLQNNLFDNIVLSGGTSLFHGIDERLIKEIYKLSPSKCIKPNIINSDHRRKDLIDGYLRNNDNIYIYPEIAKIIYSNYYDPSIINNAQIDESQYLSERLYSTWTGASILCSLEIFVETSVSKQEYDEYGPSIVHIKNNYIAT